MKAYVGEKKLARVGKCPGLSHLVKDLPNITQARCLLKIPHRFSLLLGSCTSMGHDSPLFQLGLTRMLNYVGERENARVGKFP